ncbi:MAG: signal recognition particle-docking protein FtsY [Bacteriovoracaceae bacterium]
MESNLILILAATVIPVVAIVAFKFLKPKKPQETLPPPQKTETIAPPTSVPAPAPKVPELTWVDRVRKGLSKTRKEVWGKLDTIISGKSLTRENLEEIEELLYSADIGPAMVTEIIKNLEQAISKGDINLESIKQVIYNLLKEKMEKVQAKVDPSVLKFDPNTKKMQVIMIIGVNGVGKTTTIGKLATKLKNSGAKVVVGACDTFRAAAVEQLNVWCERANVKMIRAKENADPSGVAYEALEVAIKEGADYCLLDTAGRLHTKENLMEELKKTKKVLSKLDVQAPQHVLLVLDAITGQNALKQAQEFNKALNLTGLIFTKCDGSSKAGSAAAIVQELQVPIVYLGVGESIEDLDLFDLELYLKSLLDMV